MSSKGQFGEPSSGSLFCLRCGAELTPGRGDFYVVRIEAFADPSPPDLDDWPDPVALEAEIDDLIERARVETESFLMDQVYRRLTIFLCWPCYRRWIEDPAGEQTAGAD